MATAATPVARDEVDAVLDVPNEAVSFCLAGGAVEGVAGRAVVHPERDQAELRQANRELPEGRVRARVLATERRAEHDGAPGWPVGKVEGAVEWRLLRAEPDRHSSVRRHLAPDDTDHPGAGQGIRTGPPPGQTGHSQDGS